MNNHDLFWDTTYAIVLALMEQYPQRQPDEIGLHELEQLIIQLPNFQDDPALANDRILLDIFNVWIEESF